MSSTTRLAPAPWVLRLFLWPWRIVWRLATWLVDVVGILLGLVVGFVLMALGLLLCSTIITGFIGLPLLFIGALLVLRALY